MIASHTDAATRYADTGLYTLPAAARLIAAEKRHLRSWVVGNSNSDAAPIIMRQLPDIGGNPVLGFLDLIETAFVRHFRVLGYSPQTIRKVAQKLRKRHDVEHPFAMDKRFRADGKAIFEESVADDGERKILNLMNDNFEISSVIEKSLFSQMLYAHDIAQQWHPSSTYKKVVLNPRIAFGEPVIEGAWIPTRTLYEAVHADGSIEEAADDFGVSADDVRQAFGWEKELDLRTLH
jgi:uncharacterized protein (DUF433 family)